MRAMGYPAAEPLSSDAPRYCPAALARVDIAR
jgi:hypothetical protein